MERVITPVFLLLLGNQGPVFRVPCGGMFERRGKVEPLPKIVLVLTVNQDDCIHNSTAAK